MVGRLYGVSLSPFVRKVRAVLALKAVEYELISVMPGAMDDAFRKRSPLAKIPVWEEGDFALPDSSAICAYLERAHPTPAIFPESPHAFGRTLFWEEYADTRLVEAATPIFFQRIVNARVFKQAPDEAVVRRQIEEVLPPVQDQLQALFIDAGHAADPSRGDAITLADIAVWTCFVNLEHADVAIDASRWPALAAFYAAMNAVPRLSEIVDEERASLQAL